MTKENNAVYDESKVTTLSSLDHIRLRDHCASYKDGHMDLNILIRSAMISQDRIYFNAGAGIVADSNPKAEYQETLSKAQAIFEVLGLSIPEGHAWK